MLSVSVCLSVCRTHISITTHSYFTKLPVRVASGRGSVFAGAVVICYLLPVLWITLYFRIMVPMAA